MRAWRLSFFSRPPAACNTAPAHRARIAGDAEIDVPVLADDVVAEIDLHERRHLDALAVAHAEIERRADDHDDVRLVEGERARAIEVMRIARRQEAASGAVEVAGNVEAAQQRDGFVVAAAGPDLLAEENRRPLGIDEEIGELLDVRRIADRFGRGAVLAGLRQHGLGDVDLAVEHVARDLEIARPVARR